MALLDRLRALLTRKKPGHLVGARRPSAVARPADAMQEDALRARLIEDPNDIEAFKALAELVRRRAAGVGPADPLTAEQLPPDVRRASDLAGWALSEEIAGNPRAWYALVELGRLSLEDDHEAAMRRLNGACERETTGRALAESVRMLREAGLPGEGLGLGVGHWAPKDHIVEAGRQVVLAALEADRPQDARRHLQTLAGAKDHAAASAAMAELEPRVAAAEVGNEV
ncbi:hypothetical protein FE374_09480 [Georgenia yuyongxinii]|uniref:Tetratricopeptide repeat protein n=1 Tax=Georgenia yuyongxinii TaxID=2589797 RepID=A0A5B8C2P0_9MICO|nr:hypothetical protein [Georgenia yuyongxinii]QDC24814.1 hypothetical protein FE374_09480 [Georgenia yuyongxinii]